MPMWLHWVKQCAARFVALAVFGTAALANAPILPQSASAARWTVDAVKPRAHPARMDKQAAALAAAKKQLRARSTFGGAQLRAWRTGQSMGRKACADLLGVSYYWIRLLEDSGRKPGRSLALLIEALTDIAPEDWERK